MYDVATLARRERAWSRPRAVQVLKVMPDLPGMRTLYVGANAKRFDLYALFQNPGQNLYVLEVWKPYVKSLKQSGRAVAGIMLGNIFDIATHPGVAALAPFELLVWWHGPEHANQDQARELLAPDGVIHQFYTKAILLGVPWGVFKQKAIDGNPLQEHKATYHPEWFEQLGYHTATTGKVNVKKGNITAWKRKK